MNKKHLIVLIKLKLRKWVNILLKVEW
jgi:hypothetical protein